MFKLISITEHICQNTPIKKIFRVFEFCLNLPNHLPDNFNSFYEKSTIINQYLMIILDCQIDFFKITDS